MTFGQKLIRWYLENKRDLPWRKSSDPYFIWLSEVILQQTRVVQGLPYYEKFVASFPTVFDLAQADEQQVLKIWQGLGYYSRARNLHHTAQFVVENLDGKFPSSYNELIKLKGVGSYTAAAIASFSENENVAVVDGNVYRVLSRYFGIETDITSTQGKKEFQSLADSVLERGNSSVYNQAIMEFGALQCTPKNPNCSECILSDSCYALQKNKVEQLPVKSKKTKVTKRYLNYLIFLDSENKTLINKRTQNGIWKNLYEFELIEFDHQPEFQEFLNHIETTYSEKFSILEINRFHSQPIIHKLSHQELHILFWKIELNEPLPNFILLSDLQQYPFPIVLHNFIVSNLLN